MVVEGRKWRPGCPSSLHGMFTEEPRKPGMKFEVGNGGEKADADRAHSDRTHLRDGATAICLFYFSGQATF